MSQITCAFENITPAKAERMLNNNKGNRKLREGVSERYAEDMRRGRWTNCVAPIAIYADGDLADGQHRLWAVVMAGVAVRFLVVRGIDRADGLNIDVGLVRSLVDNARISGVNIDLSNRLLSVTRAIGTGCRSSGKENQLSNAQRLALVDQYGEAARWAMSNAPSGRAFSHSLVVAAMARAWYYENDKARIAEFAVVLSRGFMQTDGDSAAVALRNFLLNNDGGFGRPDVWRDAFLKSQNAIKYFMRRKKLTMIKSVKDEVYPAPQPEQFRRAA